MYITINKKSDKSCIFKYASHVADHIGCDIKTIMRHKNDIKWEYKGYFVYNPVKCVLVGKRRGKSA